MTAEVDVNGGGGEVSVPPKDLPNGNANADGGLVFVNGSGNGNGNRDQNDSVCSDPVKTDLNSGSSVDVAGVESELDNSKPVVESLELVVESEIDQVEENGEEKIEALHLDKKLESPVVVDDGTEVDRENEVSNSTNGVPAENQGDGENPTSEADTELLIVESVNDDQPQDSSVDVCDLVDGDQCTTQKIESKGAEIAENMPSLINDSADLPVEPAYENVNGTPDLPVEPAYENVNDATDMTSEIPEANSAEEVEVDLEESAPCPVGGVELESQVVGAPVPADESRSGLDTGHTQDLIPETVVSVHLDAGQEETPELSDSFEIVAESLPSPVVVYENVSPVVSENVSIDNGQSVPAAPVSITELVDPSDVATESLQSVPAAPVSNTTAPSPVVSENVSIEEAQSVPAAPVTVGITTEPAEPDAVLGSSTVADVKNENEIERCSSDSHPVEDAKVDIQVVNGPVGDAVSSGALNNDTGLEIETGFNSNAPEDSNIEPKVDVENGPVGNDIVIIGKNDAESETEDSDMEPKVPEGVVENAPVSIDLNNDLRPETEANLQIYSNVSEEKVSTLPSDSSIEPKVSEGSSETEVELEKTSEDSNMEAKVPEGIIEGVNCQSITVDDIAALDDHTDDDPVEKEKRLATCPSDNVNVQTEIDNSQESVVISRDVPHEGGVASEYGDQNGSVSIPVHVGNGDIQFTGEGSNDKTCHQVEAIDEPHRDEAPTSTPESSVAASEAQNVRTEAGTAPEAQNVGTEAGTAPEAQNVGTEAGTAPEAQNVGTEAGTAPEAQNVGTEVVKRPFYCLIKVPRFDDENLKEQIKLFQLKVDEKTRSRDAIRDTIHTRRATFKENGENLEAAILEEKAAREMLKSKRQEIDSLQSVINKVKNAISVEDIDGRIRQIRHMIEHETVPLKEEKQLIREIEQLKQHREQFSSSMGKQDEIQQAFDQKDQIEERLKVLRKEADSLRENVSKAEAATQAARKKHKDESEKLRELQAQFKAADDIRQDAYKSLQNLRKQAYDKNKYFWNYKDDVKAANDLLSKGDKEALLNLCDNQVERVLEMWNDNDEFRKEYVRSNINSTVRRLKTLDGRSLGPNEEPPVIRSVVINRVARDNSAPQISTVKEEKPEQVVPVKTEKENKSVLVKTEKENKSMTKVGVQKDQAAKSQWPAKPAIVENGSATVSGRIEIEEPREEEPKRTKEEEELARKAEELKKKEEAAKLKEQRRLEEKVKAKEALERKKRIAEKAQARAALRAQKEAEQKEKEREKKARKKEKKKVGVAEDTSVTNEEESAPITETPTETPTISDVKDKSTTVTKKPQKQSQFTKQTKLKSVPLPLRNRGKRRMQSWMWVLIAALVVFALFLLGNSGFPFKSCLQWFGF
ncbi:hypothetical protein ACOSP7_011376 [Xanthoceras sorbifolium]